MHYFMFEETSSISTPPCTFDSSYRWNQKKKKQLNITFFRVYVTTHPRKFQIFKFINFLFHLQRKMTTKGTEMNEINKTQSRFKEKPLDLLSKRLILARSYLRLHYFLPCSNVCPYWSSPLQAFPECCH